MSTPTPPQDGAPSAAPGSDASPAPDSHDTVQPASPELLMIRRLAVGSLLGLIVLGLAWELVLAPTGNRTLVIKVLPLAVPLIGLLKNRMYTYRWVSLMIWLYFIEGVIRASGDSGMSAKLAGIEIALCVILFAACTVHVRWRLYKAQATASGTPS